MKQCTKCLEFKEVMEFRKDSHKKDGFYSQCKSCVALKAKNYYISNKSKLLAQSKDYHLKNKEERIVKKKKYNKENKQKLNESSRQYYYENKEKFKSYYENNKEKINNYNVKYRINRYKNDPHYRLTCILRGRLTDAISGKFKKGSAIRDLGCSIEEFKLYLDSKFKDGMSWDNHGEWHIDHIKPLSSFNLEDEAQLKEAVHYTNLQPLWAEDNLKKGNKILTTSVDSTTIPTVSSDIISDAANEDCQFLTSETEDV